MPKKIFAAVFVVLMALAFFSGPAEMPASEQPLTGINFKQVVLDQPPLEASGHIMVSARDFLALSGGNADWYQGKGVVRGVKGAAVTTGSLTAEIDGLPRHLEAAPVLVEGRLYIPFSLALEVAGLPATALLPGGTGASTARGEAARSVANRPGSSAARGEAAGPASTPPDFYLPPVQARAGLHFRYYPVYDLQARYDQARGEIAGELLLAYQNPYLLPLRQLVFNLPANAPYGRGARLTVSRANVNNRAVPFDVRGSSLIVSLPHSLAPRETLSLALSFATLVPEGAARLGRSGDTLMAAGWYPILAPRAGDTWAGVSATPYGDPYFASAAYYRVRLAMPPGWQVLASARETGQQAAAEGAVWTFNSEQPIREFTFAAAPGWQLTTSQAGPVQLIAASRGEPAAAALEITARALDFFQATYGPYPYSYLHLAFVPLDNLAGMEYPGLIFFSNRKTFSPATVVHEVAHQWWYNLVGNDSCQAAWIDEGLAEYSTLLYYRQADPVVYRAKLGEVEGLAGLATRPIDLYLEEYGDEQAYRQAVYNRGAKFWLELEAAAGGDRLQQALAYVQRYYRYEIVPPGALVTILTYYGRLTAANFTTFLRN